jgi:hypothetical protein
MLEAGADAVEREASIATAAAPHGNRNRERAVIWGSLRSMIVRCNHRSAAASPTTWLNSGLCRAGVGAITAVEDASCLGERSVTRMPHAAKPLSDEERRS